MATYSSAAATSIVLSSTKNITADGSSSLYTVAANEEYELLKSFVIDQDGNSSVSLFGIYDSDIISHDVPDSGGEEGFYERIDLTLSASTGAPTANDYHIFEFNLGAGNAPAFEEQVSDHTGTIWTTDPTIHRPVKFYQGAEIKIYYTASGFVAPEEAQIFLWFKKTVHNG